MIDLSTLNPEMIKKIPKKTNFERLLNVLKRKPMAESVLFEFFLNGPLHELLADESALNIYDDYRVQRLTMSAFKNAGYDFVIFTGSGYYFKTIDVHRDKSRSLNDGVMISDRKSYEAYQWEDPEDADYSRLEVLGKELPDGMKIIVCCPGGVLENVIRLTGYDNLCYMIADDPELVQEIFDQVGSRLNQYFKICSQFDSVGAMISNDDWGFNTQTMLSTADMKKYLVPWHSKIVQTIKGGGRPAIMHSCGKLDPVMDDIIDVIGFDAKHSYEDNICPVEEMYEKYHDRIAILGGIDVDFVIRNPLEEVYKRSKAMLERTSGRGGYALGTGNSVPTYVPNEQYFAMIYAALENR